MIIRISMRRGAYVPPPERVLGAFGEKLRKQREQRGLALDAISNATKISTRMLRALEDEHFDQLPGGVFNKGFVRAYARQIGLDAEETVADYIAALRESQIQAQSILPDLRTPARRALERPEVLTDTTRDNHGRKSSQGGQSDSGDIGLRDHDSRKARKNEDNGVIESERRKQDRRNQNRPGNMQVKLSHDQLNSAQLNSAQLNNAQLNNAQLNNDRPDDNRHSNDQFSDNQSNNKKNVLTADHLLPIPTAGTLVEIQPDSLDRPYARVPWGKLGAALLGVALLLAFWSLRRQSQFGRAPATAASNPSTVAATQVAVASDQHSTIGGFPRSDEAKPDRAMPAPPPRITNHTPEALPLAGAPASTKSAVTTASTRESGSTALPAKAAVHGAAVKPPSTFTLLIRAERTTWVSISADGKPVVEETLIAPAHTSVRASREIVVRADNAAGMSFLLNGKEIPVQGSSEGEVRTYVFDSAGIKVLPRPQSSLAAPNR